MTPPKQWLRAIHRAHKVFKITILGRYSGTYHLDSGDHWVVLHRYRYQGQDWYISCFEGQTYDSD